MTRFCFYAPSASLNGIIEMAADLKIPAVELDESFLSASSQTLLRAGYESGLRYVCLRLDKPLPSYTLEAISKAALWCEANYVDAILFTQPGESFAAAELVHDMLRCFKAQYVLENSVGSFLASPEDMDTFFRTYRDARLCYNAADIVSRRLHPFLDAFNGRSYRRQLYMVRVRDRRFDGKDAKPVEGDAELTEIFSAAAGFGNEVWASISPYSGMALAEIKASMLAALCRI